MTDRCIYNNYVDCKAGERGKCVSCGFNPEAYKRRTGHDMQKPATRSEQMRRLYDHGMNDRQIADELEIDRSTVLRWRKTNGLIANTKNTEL